MAKLSRNTVLAIIAGAFLLIFISGTGLAQGWGRGHMGGYGMHGYGHSMMGAHGTTMGTHMMGRGYLGVLNRLPSEYQLTGDQRTAIDKIHNAHIKEVTSLQKELHIHMIDYRSSLALSNPDDKTVQQHWNAVQDLQEQLQKEREDTWTQVRNVLTEEQLTYLDENFNAQNGFWCGQQGRGTVGGMMWNRGGRNAPRGMMWR